MMHSRGFGSDESKSAFARARTLAAGIGDAGERFDAYYGLFVGSFVSDFEGSGAPGSRKLQASGAAAFTGKIYFHR
jgi:hypothetical protein